MRSCLFVFLVYIIIDNLSIVKRADDKTSSTQSFNNACFLPAVSPDILTNAYATGIIKSPVWTTSVSQMPSPIPCRVSQMLWILSCSICSTALACRHTGDISISTYSITQKSKKVKKNFAIHILCDYGRICECFDVESLRRRIRSVLFFAKML